MELRREIGPGGGGVARRRYAAAERGGELEDVGLLQGAGAGERRRARPPPPVRSAELTRAGRGRWYSRNHASAAETPPEASTRASRARNTTSFASHGEDRARREKKARRTPSASASGASADDNEASEPESIALVREPRVDRVVSSVPNARADRGGEDDALAARGARGARDRVEVAPLARAPRRVASSRPSRGFEIVHAHVHPERLELDPRPREEGVRGGVAARGERGAPRGVPRGVHRDLDAAIGVREGRARVGGAEPDRRLPEQKRVLVDEGLAREEREREHAQAPQRVHRRRERRVRAHRATERGQERRARRHRARHDARPRRLTVREGIDSTKRARVT